jgi:carbonic anhydrase
MPFIEMVGDRSVESLPILAESEIGWERSSQIHQPIAMWIGCSDARVVPEAITGDGPGELFVLRNVANIVPPYGTSNDSIGAAIEFAVLDLQVPHIVICGHLDCGGIKALEGSMGPADKPTLARWVEWARTAQHQALAAGVPESQRHLETVRNNILLQRQNLMGYPCVSDALIDERLIIHAWLYDTLAGSLAVFDEESGAWSTLEQR